VYCTLRVDNRSTTRDVQPARPQVLAVDSAGRWFSPGYQSGQALEEPPGAGMRFFKTYTFALMQDSEKQIVEITSGPWYRVLMIGHPNSLFHGRPGTPVKSCLQALTANPYPGREERGIAQPDQHPPGHLGLEASLVFSDVAAFRCPFGAVFGANDDFPGKGP
jgi:hypothetical protein